MSLCKTDDSKVLTEAAVMQRLRRACQRRKNGKVPGGEDALELYKDTEKRLELARQLIESKFDKDRIANMLALKCMHERKLKLKLAPHCCRKPSRPG